MKVILIGGTGAGDIIDVEDSLTTIKINHTYPQLTSPEKAIPYATEYYQVYKLGPGFAIACLPERSPILALNELVQGYRISLGKRG